MQFDLNIKDTWFQHLVYSFNVDVNNLNLGNLIFCILLLLMVVFTIFLLLLAYFRDAIKSHNQINVKTSFLRFIKNIASNKYKTNIFGSFNVVMLVIILFSMILLVKPMYSTIIDSITDGTLVYDHQFDRYDSNFYDLKSNDDNKQQLTLSYGDASIPIANAKRTFNTLTLKPASKTGQAYIRVLEYIRTHKKDMYNVNVNVDLEKTTLTYADINGKHTVVCYANNKNKTSNNRTVLHY